LAMDSARKWEILSILSLMKMKACGRIESIWHAPKREALKCFGGKLSIEEFRSYGGKVEPPVVNWPFEKKYIPTIGLEHRENSMSSNSGKLKAIEDSSAVNDNFKLRREKPLARTTSKLESALGIVRKIK